MGDAWSMRVYAIVRQIPAGRVATYGLVGLLAGRPRAARAVGNVMRQCTDQSVPCHRVVHANGAPAFSRHTRQLHREGVRFIRDRVDMTRYLWRPRLRSSRL